MYEVQHYTICDGWINTWRDEQDNAITYDTEASAHRALEEWFEEMQEERDIEERYDESEFRVVRAVN